MSFSIATIRSLRTWYCCCSPGSVPAGAVRTEPVHVAAAHDESPHAAWPRDDDRARAGLARDAAREVRRIRRRQPPRTAGLDDLDARVGAERRELPEHERHRPAGSEGEAVDGGIRPCAKRP